MMFRLVIELTDTRSITIHTSADERYILSINGKEEGRGPERGSIHQFFFESYDIELHAGKNIITAKVWAVGEHKPHAQLGVCPAFLLVTEDSELDLSTGIADWQVAILEAYDFIPAKICWGRGCDSVINGNMLDWDIESGCGDTWTSSVLLTHAYDATKIVACDDSTKLLCPATLPAMEMSILSKCLVPFSQCMTGKFSENKKISISDNDQQLAQNTSGLLNGSAIVNVPPNSTFYAIIDFDNYICAYNGITVSGGTDAKISLYWAESLFESPEPYGRKGNRDVIDGKYFVGEGDLFILDGGKHKRYDGLWWHAGRYLQIKLETSKDSVVLEGLHITTTSYPLKVDAQYNFSITKLNDITPIMINSLRMCAHETLMDCPYYEQMMYVGDARLELLAMYTLSQDDRLARKAIKIINCSRDFNGRISSRYPAKRRQLIPSFDLYWVAMVYDFALWRGDKSFVKDLMPAIRMTIDHFLLHLDENGLLRTPAGWNYIDWVPCWLDGIPPVSADGFCGPLNWLMVYTLKLVVELEDWFEEYDLVKHYQNKISHLTAAINKHFWSAEHAMFADNTNKNSFSEHTQCFAILSGELTADQEIMLLKNALNNQSVSRSTIYFSHYLFECAYKLKQVNVIFERLNKDWFLLTDMGFKTTYESPLPTRSDYHAWGAHPLYHYYASIIGARPVTLGSIELSINPMPGRLESFEASIPTRSGILKINGQVNDGIFSFSVKNQD